MKTDNDILAEYVKENYPEILDSFDFSCYYLSTRASIAVREAIDTVVDAFRCAFGYAKGGVINETEETENGSQ